MNLLYIKSLLGMLFLAGYISTSYSQATSGYSTAPGANQPSGAGDYVGWTSGTNQSLEINNQDAYPINLSTNNAQRMTILGSGNA